MVLLLVDVPLTGSKRLKSFISHIWELGKLCAQFGTFSFIYRSWAEVFFMSSPYICLWFLSPPGNHTVEKRGRGEEKHVSPGCHRLSEVRRISRFRERTGTGCKRGERVELQLSSHGTHKGSALGWWGVHVNCTTSGEAAALFVAAASSKERRETDIR